MKTSHILAISLMLSSSVSFAGAIHHANLFTSNTLAANDDGSTGATAIGFSVNYFGNQFSNLFVNNNGHVTFDAALNTYTPYNLINSATPIIAPFFGDVDTRGAGSGVVQYGQAILGTHNVFGVNWFSDNTGVGYYQHGVDKLNKFQLILTDRSDIATGDFDFEFNYDQIQWETGDASDGYLGLGGDSARAGWASGINSFEIAGSAVNGELLDTNIATGLANNSVDSNIQGQYLFSVRNGNVVQASSVPEPESLLVMMIGVIGLFAKRKQHNMG
jgi:PEP-CTERM motif